MSTDRIPSIPDGKAQVSFDKTQKGTDKLVLSVPTWIQRWDRVGRPQLVTKYKRLQTSDAEMVAKFVHIIESGWFELDSQGNHVVDLVNISYFDNSFKVGNDWINYSQLVTADVAPVVGLE